MRINKYLALAGYGARRKVEQIVLDGKVTINGNKITNLATDVKDNDVVTVSGVNVTFGDEYAYYMLYKPKGYITTVSDEKGRKTVMDLISDTPQRVFPIGRLDFNTEGLLLFTNDGDLADKLMSPHSNIPKTYICTIAGSISESELAVLRAGVVIDGVRLKKCSVKVIEKNNDITKLQIVIHEGKNRQIRRMLEYIGKEVTFLKRTHIGDLKLSGITRGQYRKLKDKEIQYLLRLCKLK